MSLFAHIGADRSLIITILYRTKLRRMTGTAVSDVEEPRSIVLALWWFLAGLLTALAIMIMMIPMLRTMPRFNSLPSVPWPATAGAALIVIVAAGAAVYHGLDRAEFARQRPVPIAANGFRDAVSA